MKKGEVKIFDSYDIAVIGGGTTGICAALAAARTGAKTALIEKNGFLGGNAATGLPWLGFHNYRTKQFVVKGIPLEIIRNLQLENAATDFYLDPICSSVVGVDQTMLKIILAEMVEKEKIDVHLHSIAGDVVLGDGEEVKRLKEVYLYNKQGCQCIRAKIFIDCTDSADIAAAAGETYARGRASDGKVQVSSHVFTVGNVNMNEMISYFEDNPDQMRPFVLEKQDMDNLIAGLRKAQIFVIGAFPRLVEKARKEGLDIGRDRMIGAAFPYRKELLLVTSRIEDVDPNNIHNISRAELEGIIRLREIMKFVNQYMPGGKNAYIVRSGHQIGIRETRHIKGKYTLTAEDLMEGKIFKDSIARGAYHIDIHSPDHKGLETNKPLEYTVPYRSLIPLKTENLLIAGRCISADHSAMASTRVIPISAAMGQAAGMAAGIAVKYGCMPEEIRYDELKEELISCGALV